MIILNASRHSCDAVIVLADAELIHIAFRQGTYFEIVTVSSDFAVARIGSNSQEEDERRVAGLLRCLWDSIVCEVVHSLEPHVPKNS